MDQRVRPAHDLYRAVVLAHEIPYDFDGVASHVDQRAAPGLFDIPKPGAVRPRMRFAGAHPQNISQRPFPYAPNGLERFGRIHEVFEIAVKHPGLLHHVQHAPGFGGGPPQRLGAQDAFACFRRKAYAFLVEVVGQANDYHVRIGMADGGFQVVRMMGYVPLSGEGFRPFRAARKHAADAVPSPGAIDGQRIEHADEAGPEEGDGGAFLRSAGHERQRVGKGSGGVAMAFFRTAPLRFRS